jgi:hypothetical protein
MEDGALVGQILEEDYPRIIPSIIGLTLFSGFREEDLNMIFY